MKKIFGILVAGAIILSSCGNSTPKANLNTKIDTLSYVMGMQPASELTGYLTTQLGIDSADIDEVLKGIAEVINAGDGKKEQAYLQGLMLGAQLKQMYNGINQQIAGKDSVEVLNKNDFMSGFFATARGEETKLNRDSMATKIDALMSQVQATYMEKEYGKNRVDGDKFLKENAKKDSVQVLPSGVQFKVLKGGNGTKATEGQTVNVKYEGRTIDGKVFDSNWSNTEGMDMMIGQMIPGFNEALLTMDEGAIWEVYIPQDKAYGPRAAGQIKPFSTLIFKIELVKVK
ncbi:MAG: FKBP-type peptidyl-prolyl cis-trans isomerase [Prevotella sp.]|nr:FKBP-type peptidyl-prolyl cis-trans isomerase [Candidatus Equicola faecalis]